MLRVVVVIGLCALFAPAALADDDEAAPPSSSEGFIRLVEVLQSGASFKVRATAAVALGRMGDQRAIPVLAAVVDDDDNYAVRAAAVTALGRMNDPGAVAPLMDALDDADEYVRNEAADALDRFHTPQHLYAFRDALTHDDATHRLAAVRAYGDVMREPSSSPALAAFVVAALGDEDEAVAAAAETAINDLGLARAVPLLVDGLLHGTSAVRGVCARLTEKRADPRTVEPLIALLVDVDEPDDVRRPARMALKRHAEYLDAAAYAAQVSAVGDPNRLTALRVLAALGDSRALPAIDVALKDKDVAVRVAAARAALDFGGAKAKAAVDAAVAAESDPRSKRQLELIAKSFAR